MFHGFVVPLSLCPNQVFSLLSRYREMLRERREIRRALRAAWTREAEVNAVAAAERRHRQKIEELKKAEART